MDYRALYYQLFAAAADAVELLEQKRPERAREVLIDAQRRQRMRYFAKMRKILRSDKNKTLDSGKSAKKYFKSLLTPRGIYCSI